VLAKDKVGEVSKLPPLPLTLRRREMSIKINSSGAVQSGITIGSALAICISWSMNKSILWAILHGICSWFYVIYHAIKY
jgi:hypothetical protein